MEIKNLSKFAITIFEHKIKIVVAIFIIILIVLSLHLYNNYALPMIHKTYADNKEFIDKERNEYNEVEVLFFYTTWCPYSTKAIKEWKAFKEEYKKENVKSKYTLAFTEVNGDDPNNEELLDKYKIKGYPTIKLKKDPDNVIELNAKISVESLKQFVHDV